MARHKKEGSPYRWAATVFVLAVALSGALGLGSQILLSGTDVLAACGALLAFILLGILFDMIGVAVTAADPVPFHAMASHRVGGAKEALDLIRSAGRVSSVCNDVVGDICGIVSGVTGAVIVEELQRALDLRTIGASVAVTALISGLTIGGKALAKAYAIRESGRVVHLAGRFLHLFHRRPRRVRKAKRP